MTPEPWTVQQLRVLVGANLVGLALLVVAWGGARETAKLSDQIGWLNLAVVAVVIGAASNASWLLAGRRAVGRRRHRVLADEAPEAVVDAAPVPVSEGEWVWLPGTKRGHRPGCPMIAGKPAAPVDRDHIAAEGLQRCEVCATP